MVADILRAATLEFSTHGFGGARLERIIQSTRTSKRMVYYHFQSKEGLYRAVLEQAFATARAFENTLDPNTGDPEILLRQLAGGAFDAMSRHPDFVRLLTFENLGGAAHVKGSALISQLNQAALKQLERVLERGRDNGSFRHDVSALDTYITLVGLSYYHVANKSGFVAGGFSADMQERLASVYFDQQRRLAIVDAVCRYVKS